MKHVMKGNTLIIRMDKGEEIISSLQEFAQKRGIDNAYFTCIGAVDGLRLGMYALSKKKYLTKDFSEDLEIASMNGNIFLFEGKPLVHCHGVFGRADFSTVAGHVMSAKVSVTCEMFIVPVPGKTTKKTDRKTGLKFLEL